MPVFYFRHWHTGLSPVSCCQNVQGAEECDIQEAERAGFGQAWEENDEGEKHKIHLSAAIHSPYPD